MYKLVIALSCMLLFGAGAESLLPQLAWIDLTETNRAPVAVAAGVTCAQQVVAVQVSVCESAARAVNTCAPGLVFIFR